MKQNYEYPLELDWTKEEILAVMTLLQSVESAYEGGIELDTIEQNYKEYKKYFKAIKDEKILDRKFKQASGYSMYEVIKKMKNAKDKKLVIRL